MFNLNDDNRDEYILEIQKYLNRYLLKGTSSFQSDDIMDFLGLKNNELNILKAAHFLLNKEVDDLFCLIPNLFRNLPHSTNKVDMECQGIVRGNINWNKTIKSRYSGGLNDKSLFVCSPPIKHYDLDENRLLKFLFKEIIYLYETILRFNKSKEKSPVDPGRLYQESEQWYERVEEKYILSRLCIQNIYFGGVSDVDFISQEALKKAKNHRNPIYHHVARVYELYEKIFILDDREFFEELVQNQLIIASDNNTLFEIYSLFNIISKLEEEAEYSFKIPLYFRENNTEQVSAVLSDSTTINIFYQKNPPIFNKVSKNKNLNYVFDFSTQVRMPDIIIKITKKETSYFRIVELKNSSDPDYMRESLYKVLGYYKDFEGVPFTKNIPIVVINWNGSKINKNIIEDTSSQEVLFFNKDEFLENIDMLFEI